LISTINSNKNNFSVHSYTSYDFSPSLGTVYYRLSQKDVNGKVSIIGLAVVETTDDKIIIGLSPVPFSDHLHLVLHPQIKDARVQLINSIGAILYEIDFDNVNSIDLPCSELPPGMYQIIVYSDLGIDLKSIIKEK
jgi:hypothetical protein